MTIKEILKQVLISGNYDGFYRPIEIGTQEPCSCMIDELCWCDDNFSNCRPGYLHPGDNEYEFHIKEIKADV